MRDLQRDGDDRPQHDGVLEYVDADGRDIVLDIEVNVRGKSREEFCTYPPLKIDFVRDEVEGTVFAGQNKLKLVTLCERTPDFRAYLAKEFLIYRLFNELTDRSFRVRWAEIDYVDESRNKPDEFSAPAFFIEDDREVADRLGLEVVEREHQLPIADLEPRHTTLLALFQYMIGNTDWADARVHNVAIVAVHGRIVPVPYDFDFAGAVGAPYAIPSPNAPIHTVEQRFYQGWCWPGLDTEAVLGPFREAHPSVEELVRGFTPLPETSREGLLAYLGGFWEAIATPERAQRRLFRDCRKVG